MYRGKKVAAIIAAAGSGKRMGISGVNKVYMELAGKAVLARTLSAFEGHPAIDEIVVAVKTDEMELGRRLIKENGFQKVTVLTEGGKERQDTVDAAVRHLSEDTQLVLIHDGARPLVDGETIEKTVEAASRFGAAAAGVAVKDTIKITQTQDLGEEGMCRWISETPERSLLWAMQTPQGFEVSLLRQALGEAKKNGFYGTDEAVLVEKIGKKVFIVQGKYDNIKVTTYEDIAIAEALLHLRENAAETKPRLLRKGEEEGYESWNRI